MERTDCPVWGTPAEVVSTDGEGRTVDSPRAGGRYKLTAAAETALRGWPSGRATDRAALSQMILEGNILGAVPYFDANDLQPESSTLRRRSYSDNLELLLRTIVWRHPLVGDGFADAHAVSPQHDPGYLVALAWESAAADRPFSKLLDRYLDHAARRGLTEVSGGDYALTLEGHQFVEELGLVSNSRDRIFVAMWFGSEDVNRYYDEAVRPAIEDAGYLCVRIDQTHHNERIDEQILAEIRKSRCVFVDITCGLAAPESWSSSPRVGAPRGGVYFEAGFAAGVGVPIIWSVQKEVSSFENVVHFDVRQYNQFRWDGDHAYNREFLQARIEATIGRGRR